MIIKISSNSRICQSPVLIIFFLLLPIIATSTGTPPAVKKSNFSSILIPFPFFGLTGCCIRKWLESDSFSNNSLFMKDMTLEVHEFSIREDTGYVVRYCKTPISSSLNSTLTTIDGKDGRAQKKCKFGFFIDKKWKKTIERDRKMINEMGQVIVAMGWEKDNFTFCLFAIDNPISSSTQFPIVKWKNNEENAHLALKKDEDRKATLCWNKLIFQSLLKYYRIWLYLMLGLGSWFLLVGKKWLCIIIKKRKDIKLRKEFFKRNGGILLQQQLTSFDSGIERCKIFNSNELNRATDHFNVNRVLGEGGQGTVYKGMLEDGRVIAIKKSKVIDEEKLAEFINEVVILSQINHRNVVKLLGCCLETEVPMLVYEFIANGTIFQYIHDHNEELAFTWDMRLRIANEVAGALSYLHSTASSPIYHRDIKSSNILLDNKYRAKVADFGASRSIAIDQTHLTTKVQGTLGYLDPEYFQSNQLTDKSDVYSFGIILVELLTGQKAIFSTTWQENVSLATLFIHYMKENRLYDILDAQIVMRQGKKDGIMAFANLAKRCLNPSGKERPTMKEVERELEEIRASKKRKPMFSRFMKKLK